MFKNTVQLSRTSTFFNLRVDKPLIVFPHRDTNIVIKQWIQKFIEHPVKFCWLLNQQNKQSRMDNRKKNEGHCSAKPLTHQASCILTMMSLLLIFFSVLQCTRLCHEFFTLDEKQMVFSWALDARTNECNCLSGYYLINSCKPIDAVEFAYQLPGF